MIGTIVKILRSEGPAQFMKFCVVGTTGLLVDMTILCLLADPRFLALNVSLSKVCAAEVAMINNFTWNEIWTFRPSVTRRGHKQGLLRRFLLFNVICAVGVGLAILLLYLFYIGLSWNLYLSNLLAIIVVTFWNFGLNAKFNWTNRKC